MRLGVPFTAGAPTEAAPPATGNGSMSEPAASSPRPRRIPWRIKLIGYALMAAACLGVFELSAYLYMRLFAGYDGQHLMSYEFDDYKNIRLTPGFRNTLGVAHNNQG